ncbi:MAG: DUF2905 domain-containing protein [Synechococcus sp.]
MVLNNLSSSEQEMVELGKMLLMVGMVLVLVGGLLWLSGGTFKHVPLGRLPGDIAIERDNFTFYFPLATSILLSLGLSALFWLARSLFR